MTHTYCDGLLNDAGIIRNRLKVEAAIANAQRILELRKTYGSFAVYQAILRRSPAWYSQPAAGR